jgi:hypothetical protein
MSFEPSETRDVLGAIGLGTVMHRVSAIVLVTLLAHAPPALGDAGCLTPAPELAARADIIIAGKITRVKKLVLPPCPDAVPQPGQTISPTYARCGTILEYTVKVSHSFRGGVLPTIRVRVPYPAVLNLSCDDRPSPKKMGGVYAALFLQESDGYLWLVNGPSGVHIWSSRPSEAEIEEMRDVVSGNPRVRSVVR